MRTAFVLTAALLAPAFAVPAWAQSTEEAPAAEPAPTVDPGTVLATVNGVEITLGHVAQLYDQLPQQYRQLPDEVIYNGILEQVVDQQLLSETQGTDIPANVQRALDNELRGMMARRAVTDLLAGDVADAEVEQAYEEQYASVEPDKEFHASHILVETEEEALALIEQLEGGADFAELAKEKSTGPSGPNGGELGWFGKGAMVPSFEAAVMEMEPEAISAPVETRFGWHVIRLNEVRELPVPTLEEVRERLVSEIQQAKLEAHVATLRDAAEIDMKDTGLPPSVLRDMTLLEN